MESLKLYEEYMEENLRNKLKAKKDKLIKKAKKFGKALGQEGKETKDIFKKIKASIKAGEKLTPKEKAEIKQQMGDILKTAGLTASTFLPGGVIYIMLTQNKHTKKYTLPSSFMEKDEDGDFDYLK
tara:strand:- start:560 stop:937 length:378 start_codon:yes stop_codon:yes gene_type:complete